MSDWRDLTLADLVARFKTRRRYWPGQGMVKFGIWLSIAHALKGAGQGDLVAAGVWTMLSIMSLSGLFIRMVRIQMEDELALLQEKANMRKEGR